MTDAPHRSAGPGGAAGPSHFPRADDALEWLLERLLTSTAQPYDAERVRQAVLDCSALGADLAPLERLARGAASLGLRSTIVRATTEEVLELVGAERPAVGLGGGDAGWVILDDRSGSRVRVARPGRHDVDWLGAKALERDLASQEPGGGAPASSGPRDWLLVDPSTPLEAARGAGGGSGGPPTPLRRLLAILRVERDDVWTVLVYAAGVGVLGLATPIAVQSLVNTVAFGTLVQPLVVLVALLFAVLAFAAVLQLLEFWVVELLQRRIFVRLVADLAHRLPRTATENIGEHHAPEVVNRFFDVFSIQKTLAFLLLDGLGILLTALTGMLVLAFYHPYLLAFDVFLVIAIVALIVGLGRPATKTSVNESKKKYKVEAWFEEVARNLVTFKHGGAAEHQRYRAETLARDYLDARKGHFRIVLRQVIAALVLQTVASAGLLGIGGWLVITRELTLGQLVAAELIVATVVGSLAKLGKHLESFYDLLASVDKVGHLLDLPVEHDDGERFLEVTAAEGSRLQLRSLELGFPDSATGLRVDALELQPGERVALTGPSGSGKSALLDVLFGLRSPKAGRVEIDGSDVRDLRLEELRTRVALVRGGDVFEGSIAENVRLGRPGLSLGEVRRALDLAGLYDEVAGMRDGLQTVLSSNGAPLSQGQILRLAVARALAASPSLVLVDDVIDRLDPESRARVFDALAGEHDTRRTVIAVTSDRDLHARCDLVLVARGGRLSAVTDPSTEAA